MNDCKFLKGGIKVEFSGWPPICCPPQMDFFLLWNLTSWMANTVKWIML